MGADAQIRTASAEQPVPDLGDPPFVLPRRLDRARVAIVTTAGLQRPGEPPWVPGQAAFRAFGSGERELIVGNVSQNYDRTGAMADLNVVYPADRLAELAATGEIGEVAPRHLSFMGALPGELLQTVILDTGPAAARALLDDGVDVAILTPV